MNSDPRTLYIFLDESGNLDFSKSGTAHYVLAAVVTTSPLEQSRAIQKLKYEMLERGIDIEGFHASEDKQVTRNLVLEKIGSMSNSMKVHFIHAQKDKTHPSLRKSSMFYGKLGTILVKYIVVGQYENIDKVMVVFDKALTKKEQNAFLGEIKPALKKIGKPYHIYFHRTLSDFNGQIADYFAWSKYVSLERGELRPLASLSNVTKTSFDLFERGTKIWY
jgi:Protein of unknown function (DUF3800)